MKNNVYDYVINNVNVLLKNGIEYYESVDADYKIQLERIYNYINGEEEIGNQLEDKALEVQALSNSYLDKMTDIKISVLDVENDMNSFKESIEAKNLYVSDDNYEPSANIYEDENNNDEDFVVETPVEDKREEIELDEVPEEELYVSDKPIYMFDENGTVTYDRHYNLTQYKFDKDGVLIEDKNIESSDVPPFGDESTVTVELKNSLLKYKFDANGIVVLDREYDLSKYKFDKNGMVIEDGHAVKEEKAEPKKNNFEKYRFDEFGNVIFDGTVEAPGRAEKIKESSSLENNDTFDGQIMEKHHDELGNAVKEDIPVKYRFDANGKVISDVEANKSKFKFDELGNVIFDGTAKETAEPKEEVKSKNSNYKFDDNGVVTYDRNYVLSQFKFDASGNVVMDGTSNSINDVKESAASHEEETEPKKVDSETPSFKFDANGVVTYDREQALKQYKFDENGFVIADASVNTADVESTEPKEETNRVDVTEILVKEQGLNYVMGKDKFEDEVPVEPVINEVSMEQVETSPIVAPVEPVVAPVDAPVEPVVAPVDTPVEIVEEVAEMPVEPVAELEVKETPEEHSETIKNIESAPEKLEDTTVLDDLFSDDIFDEKVEEKVAVETSKVELADNDDNDDSSSGSEVLEFNFEEIISDGEEIEAKEEEIEIKQEEPSNDELVIEVEAPKKKSFFDLFKKNK